MGKIEIQNLESIEKNKFESSVGAEFVNWAEQYWGLKKKYDVSTETGEDCPFDYVRETFIHKINDLVKERLGV